MHLKQICTLLPDQKLLEHIQLSARIKWIVLIVYFIKEQNISILSGIGVLMSHGFLVRSEKKKKHKIINRRETMTELRAIACIPRKKFHNWCRSRYKLNVFGVLLVRGEGEVRCTNARLRTVGKIII